LNILNPNAEPNIKWPQISFFGIYDGHAGNSCADFLKENLHQFVKVIINLLDFQRKVFID
jgi:protein phosphatase 2C family protein 2/3